MLATQCQLLAAGADPNAAKEHHGNTALHEAARNRNHELIRLLAAWGADPLRTNKQGSRPLQVA